MPYKTVLVHIDSTPRCATRVDLALSIAKQHGGRVHACMAQLDPAKSMIDPVHRASDRLKQEFERVKEDVTARAEAAGVEVRFSMSPLVTSANVIHYLVRAARHADLVVVGQYDRETDKGVVPEDMTEQAILNAGRPVLVVPYAGNFPKLTDHVMVAWNAGREAARALSDGMPLLTASRKASVLVIRGPNAEGEAAGPGYDKDEVAHFLAGHGVTSDLRTATAEQIGIVDMLLSRAADESVTLLLMGAHGHYGFPHILRGGVTRDMLRQMTVPVLFSH
ncbi:universal stress protein [Caenispirillum salinarum]|uniref:universal stress protein n=1 Tax=Caenispirillum salinarum TaxID=859058 RepID=UPI00384BDC1D